MNNREIYGFDVPLKQDSKGRYYLPSKLFCNVLYEDTILINTPSIGVTTYKVHNNKDGSYWIKGDNIAKYWFKHTSDVPRRLFLDEEIIKKIRED